MRAIHAFFWMILTSVLVACGGGDEPADAGQYAGGLLSGLAAGNSVVLTSGSETKTLNADGAYRFGRFPAGTRYDIRAQSTSADQVCEVQNGVGEITNVEIDNVRVVCVPALAVGGTVSGLNPVWGTLVLGLNNGDQLAVTGNGPFQFGSRLIERSTYIVSIVTQPTQAVCTLAQATAVLTAETANQTQVVCEPLTGQVGFTVTGLTSTDPLVVQLNGSALLGAPGSDRLVQVTTNGGQRFAAQVPASSTYEVTIAQPAQTHECSVVNGSGTFSLPGVSNVVVDCKPVVYTVAVPVTVTGLSTEDSLALRLNINGSATPAQVVSVVSNGNYSFSANMTAGTPYAVGLSQAPAFHTCTIVNGSNVFSPPQAMGVQVNCVPDALPVSVGVVITGLAVSDSLVLRLDAPSFTGPVTSARLIQASDNGNYGFNVQLRAGETYEVVLTQPSFHECTVSNASGVFTPPSISTVGVSCVPRVYEVTVGVNITGMVATDPLVLQLNGSSFANPVSANRQIQASNNGAYSFTVQMPAGASYQAVLAQTPSGHTCTLSSNSGTFVPPSVGTMSLNCAPLSFSVSGQIEMWSSDTALIRLSNGSTVRVNGSTRNLTLDSSFETLPFVFPTPVPFGSSFTVTVPEPPGFEFQEPMTCTITNGSGTMPASNVTNVAIFCSYAFFAAQPL